MRYGSCVIYQVSILLNGIVKDASTAPDPARNVLCYDRPQKERASSLRELTRCFLWSGRRDSNSRPLAPHPGKRGSRGVSGCPGSSHDSFKINDLQQLPV